MMKEVVFCVLLFTQLLHASPLDQGVNHWQEHGTGRSNLDTTGYLQNAKNTPIDIFKILQPLITDEKQRDELTGALNEVIGMLENLYA